ncbi:MAG TPA: FAD-binding oxidoreductase [Acidimicrobiales bacterium]
MPESLARLETDLAEIVGPGHVLTDPGTKAAFETDWTRRFNGAALLVVRPESTDEVARVVAACAGAGVPVVTQGGNTGLVGGAVPGPAGPAPVVLSTSRLTWMEQPDPVAAQVTAGAGVTLARLQQAAREVGLSFPVDLAARDSATVGGLVATNAGGLHVLRYGSTRAQVIGLEVVLADGTAVSRLGGLVKDNTGYDLSQLMVGSEGTLGVVTAARLRLVPAQNERVVALLGLGGVGSALDALDVLRRRAEGLQAAELFFEDGLHLVTSYSGAGDPLPRRWPVYLLVECAGVRDVSESLFDALMALELDESATAAATDPAGMERLWSYRERHTEAISTLGIPHKLDVTLPLRQLEDFVDSVREAVEKAAPGSQLVLFGHVGDGNLHVNVVGPDPEDETVDEAVLDLVASLGGSISAEHGVGRAKTKWLHLSRSPAELAAMRAVKSALDPTGLLNPGVLLE